jgi:hypothetical protein
MKYMTASLLVAFTCVANGAYAQDSEFKKYADSFQFVGKNSGDAFSKLSSEGFACRAVGGIQTDIPPEEPILLCAKSSGATGCRSRAEIILRLEWAGAKFNPSEMPKKDVKEVRAHCFP